MDELVKGSSGMLYPAGDDLFPVVPMEPRKSTPVVIVTPERLAALEAEVERLRGICDDVRNTCIDLASVGPIERGHAFATFWPTMNDKLRSARGESRVRSRETGDA